MHTLNHNESVIWKWYIQFCFPSAFEFVFFFHWEEQSQNAEKEAVTNTAATIQLHRLECLCVVVHVWPVNHQQWLNMRLSLCLGSTCGQDTIAASVVKRKDGLEFPSFQFVHFYYWRQQRWKITGVLSQLPFVTLTKSAPLALRLQKHSSGLKQKSKGLLFPGTVIPLKEFPLGLTWLTGVQTYCSSNQIQYKINSRKRCIMLTDALCTSLRFVCSLVWSAILVQLCLFLSWV